MPDVTFVAAFGLNPSDKTTRTSQGPLILVPHLEWLADLRTELRIIWNKGQDAGRDYLTCIFDVVRHLDGVQEQTRGVLRDRRESCSTIADLYSHFDNALPFGFRGAVARVMRRIATLILGLQEEKANRDLSDRLHISSAYGSDSSAWVALLEGLYRHRLLGHREDAAWGSTVVHLLRKWVDSKFGAVHGDVPAASRLRHAVMHDFAPFVWQLSHVILEDGTMIDLTRGEEKSHLNEQFSNIALSCLGLIRCRWLCDAVLKRDSTMRLSGGAIADLQVYMSTPDARSRTHEAFYQRLDAEVLHSGRSTVEILEIYVRLITVLKAVDSSGVVLRSISEPMKEFLRSREDAVTIILNSLLETSRDGEGKRRPPSHTFCVGVAECMEQEESSLYREYYEGSDLLDLGWTPEPIDAPSGHHATRSLDAMAHLVSLEHRDTFIRELQNVLASRLLNSTGSTIHQTGTTTTSDGTFAPEIRLLNIFKQRFTELHLQSSEIMLRDVLESQRLNAEIRGHAATDVLSEIMNTEHCEGGPVVDFHAVVLSRFYWPDLPEESCKWSHSVEEAAAQWAHEFGVVKKQRRLEWLRGLGSAKVELEFEDRKVVEDCTTWQAGVIYAFHSDPPATTATTPKRTGKTTRSPAKSRRSNSPPPLIRSITALADQTGLSTSLVRAACVFWTDKLVLRATSAPPHLQKEDGGGIAVDKEEYYTVLETLPGLTPSYSSSTSTPGALANQAAQSSPANIIAPSPTPALKSPAAMLRENSALYASFVIGILTNQGAMTSDRVLGMLRMTVPGGFPFEEGELVEFLKGLEEEQGVMESGEGGVWRVGNGTGGD